MIELSERQKEFLTDYAPEVSKSSRFNLKAAIKRKLMDIEKNLTRLRKENG